MRELILIALIVYLTVGATLGVLFVLFADAAGQMEENAKVRIMAFLIMLFAWPCILRWTGERK